tara:strand:+ start:2202 stop:2447 length:246 start_codon:yes stop_codon:yes gene_type:complete
MLEKVVMNIWHGVPRFGRVIEEKTENNWKFVKVDWVEDHEFEVDRQRVIRLRGYDKYSEWYRADKVSVINPSKLIHKLSEL